MLMQSTVENRRQMVTFTVANQIDSNVTTIDNAAIADAVWDEVLTGATHNIPTSAGKRLRQVADIGVYEGGQVGLIQLTVLLAQQVMKTVLSIYLLTISQMLQPWLLRLQLLDLKLLQTLISH